MKNNTAKYLKYAVGEIVLVVIGILIALSINNWNENRLAEIEEESMTFNLHKEFSQNEKALKVVLAGFDKSINAGRKIMSLIGQSRIKLKSINTDSLMFLVYDYRKFYPSENALSGLIESGGLQLLQNEKLKQILYNWSKIKLSIEGVFEDVDVKVENDLIPYLSKNHSLKDIDSYGDLKWKSKSTLKVDKLKIFEDIEYENLMDDLLFRLLAYSNELKKAKIIIDNIIKETSSND